MSRERKPFVNCEAISPDKDRIKGKVKWYDGLKVVFGYYKSFAGLWIHYDSR